MRGSKSVLALLAQMVDLLRQIEGNTRRDPLAHPSANWCRGTNQDGRRCLSDAVEGCDGFCRIHWRKAERARLKRLSRSGPVTSTARRG